METAGPELREIQDNVEIATLRGLQTAARCIHDITDACTVDRKVRERSEAGDAGGQQNAGQRCSPRVCQERYRYVDLCVGLVAVCVLHRHFDRVQRTSRLRIGGCRYERQL